MAENPSISARKPVLAAWCLAAALALAVSWSLPLFSGQDPGSGSLSFPRLYPVYFQSNVDAPLEIQTSLGFPGFYREQPYRISRPTFYAALAGIREFLAAPVAGLFLGEGPRWGPWSSRDYLLTYFLWLLANAACVLASVRLAHGLIAARLPGVQASLAALMLLTTPIVLLAMREIHLNAFQIFTGLACLAFWQALLGGRIRGRGTVLASLLLGLAFLGKPNLNLFGAGAFLCVLLGQGRKLLAVIPAVLLPGLLWFAAVKAMGMRYAVPEVTEWRAGVWIFQAGAPKVAAEFAAYAGDWLRVLGESLTPFHLLFAALGGGVLWRRESGEEPPAVRPRLPFGALRSFQARRPGRAFLALAALIAAADFVFYFLVHRVHAVYYVGTLLGLYALAAAGLLRAADWALSRGGPPRGAGARAALALAALVLMQVFLAIRQLPRYPG